MGEGINLVLYARVVIGRVAVEVAELKGILLKGGALERCGNVGVDEGSASEGHEALKTLHKKDNVLVVHVFLYLYYLTFSVCSIKVGVEVAQVGLILPLCGLRKGVGSRECFW